MTYEQTPFPEYEPKVRELCKTLWPFSTPGGTKVERLEGGSFNRIIGIEVDDARRKSNDDKRPGRFILRVPRDDEQHPTDLRNQVALLDYLSTRTTIPVPRVVACDATSDNILGDPYVIQTRIFGENLYRVGYRDSKNVDGLTHAQWCSFTRQFAAVVRELQSITSPVPGVLAGSDAGGPVIHHLIDRIYCRDSYNDARNEATGSSALEFILFQFERMRTRSLQLCKFEYPLYRDLCRVAKQADRLGWLDDAPATLCHLDLEPRNIMVQLDHDNDAVQITGIVDWDSALFLPQFMGCRPPAWLWIPGDQHPEDPEKEDEFFLRADETPSDPLFRERKEIFERHVGERFLSMSYPGKRHLVRKLCNYAVIGLHSSWVKKAAEGFVTECFELFDELRSDRRREKRKEQRSRKRQRHKRQKHRQRRQRWRR